MTFFFQTNPIIVILKIILALLSFIIAVVGCFCYTVPCYTGGGVGWCKNPCVFVRKNIHISSIINTFLSLHLTVIGGSRSGR